MLNYYHRFDAFKISSYHAADQLKHRNTKRNDLKVMIDSDRAAGHDNQRHILPTPSTVKASIFSTRSIGEEMNITSPVTDPSQQNKGKIITGLSIETEEKNIDDDNVRYFSDLTNSPEDIKSKEKVSYTFILKYASY